MEPAAVTTRSKTRFFKGLRRLCSSTGHKIHRFAIDSVPNRYASAEHSITSDSSTPDQYSNTPKIPAISLEQHTDNVISPTTAEKPHPAQQSRLNIDTLPDLVLLHLFTYLNAQDLCNLGWCAPNLWNVARSQKKFWKNVQHTCNGSSPSHRRLRPFLSELTTNLHLSKDTDLCSSDIANGHRDTCLEPNFFKSLKNLPNLRSLTLENHSLEYRHMLNLKCLPKSLTELRLKSITFLDLNGEQGLAFEDLHLYLPNLEVVDVSHCSWMNSHILCSLSQCPRLKRLIMFGCKEFNFIVPYLATATICGFWELETLDLRLTHATFYHIKIFKKLKNLKHILLERPEETPREGPCRQMNLLYNNRLDFNQDLKAFQLQPLAITTDINPVNNAGSRRLFRLSEYFNVFVETLVVRNYPEITDSTLQEIETYFSSVKYLDITGTKCTAEGVAVFQNQCPEIRVLHESIS